MKRILGLDLGTASIGWAIVEEAENKQEKSSIIRVGSRVNPLTTDEKSDFERGKSISTNASRTEKRGIRRSNQRYKLRRENLKNIMLREGWITEETILAEHGNRTTFETLRLRAKAAESEVSLEEFARVLLMINKKRGYKSNRKADHDSQMNGDTSTQKAQKSSTYLGEISERHNELSACNMTVGQYLVARLNTDPNLSLKNTVFYRQDYIDEFDKIWTKQAEFHPMLTDELRKEVGSTVIFYQRPLKSQKGLVSVCEFESHEQVFVKDGKRRSKIIGLKVCPKSSPLFQEFKVWQIVNNLTINHIGLLQEEKELLFSELNTKPKMSKRDVLKLLRGKSVGDINYKELDGNRTQATFFKVYAAIIESCGYDINLTKERSARAYEIIEEIFHSLNYKTDFLHFDACLEGEAFQMQPAYQLWHLLYSYEGDQSTTGNEGLISKIRDITGFSQEHAQMLAQITFKPEYGNLSSKAIRKIMPFLRNGEIYSEACEHAGYRHSKGSLTKEELDAKILKDHLTQLPKNSLRSPVVEKILNQMVNLVNSIIDTYGKPDEIRIELARELKKSAKERKGTSDRILSDEKRNSQAREEIRKEFGIQNPSRNDVTRYKLYKELESRGYRTLYSNTYIPKELLFSGKDFDIEHIIPQAKLFDDSFSNKTIEKRDVNIEKGNLTAYDYVKLRYGEEGLAEYKSWVEDLYSDGKGKISKTKRDHLLMPEAEIPNDFIERDLRESQYIAKKAKSMLEEVVRNVVTTTGSITSRLREDWQLVNVMQELNWDKYAKLGLTEYVEDKDGKKIPRIKDWTKRNDHRHHAMDAIVIAFTKRSYIQYLNNLNARIPKGEEERTSFDLSKMSLSDLPFEQRGQVVRAIETNQLSRDDKGKLRFIPPIPLDEFRTEAKRHLDNCLVSIKAKNKVVTRNINTTKKAGGSNVKIQLTPRGQLHKETLYGQISRYETKEERIGATFTADKIAQVANKSYREALLKRLQAFDSDPKKAFTGKNSLKKLPLYLDEAHNCQVPEKVKMVDLVPMYTTREPISKDLNLEKIVDEGIKRILQARLEEYDNNPSKAFSNLDQNPIWLNKEKGIQIKSVTISGVSNAIPLHPKTDHLGRQLLNEKGEPIRTDYVSPRNNHHVAIFRDSEGNLQECIVSFYEAVQRAYLGVPIIDKEYNKHLGWKFLFTMKQNEYFVFPNEATQFDPNDIDLLDPENYNLISPNLYRVQKLAAKYYVFRHHLETTVDEVKELRNTAWKRCQRINDLQNVVKVRLNHMGQIVEKGEY